MLRRNWIVPLLSGVLALSMVILPASLALAQESEDATPIEAGDNKACTGCHGKDGSFEAGDKHYVTEEMLKTTVHKESSCTDCHSSVDKFPHDKKAGPKKVNCLGCHEETVNSSTLIQKDPPGGYAKSVHAHTWEGMVGVEMPTCLTCHSTNPHDIHSPKKWNKKQMAENCSRCHSDVDKMNRHNIKFEAAKSYFQSFHGKAVLYGSQTTATCVDCHNAHNVQNPAKQIASTNPAHLQDTCNNCHPGSNYQFAMAGTGHLTLEMEKNPVLKGTNWFFYGVAIFAFSMLGIALLFDIRSRFFRHAAHANGITEAESKTWIPRWSLAQRLQHFFLAASITVLVLTGFPLRFPEREGLIRIYNLFGGIEGARLQHRVAGIVLLVVAVWHLLMLFYRWLVLRWGWKDWTMLWNMADVEDAKETAKYYIGKRETMPDYPKYSYREKLDYACEYWGVPIMLISGFILWFPAIWAELLPGPVIGMSYIAHGIEATIAAVVIVTWHMYHTFFVAGVKNNKSWFNGKVTIGYLKHHHRREYDKLKAEGRIPETEEPQPEPASESPTEEPPAVE